MSNDLLACPFCGKQIGANDRDYSQDIKPNKLSFGTNAIYGRKTNLDEGEILSTLDYPPRTEVTTGSDF